MSDHAVLNSVLDATLVPHQPYVIIVDSAVFSGLPVFKESLKRALNRGGPVLLVSALHNTPFAPFPNLTTLDLTSSIPGYAPSESDLHDRIISTLEKLGAGAQIYIDAIDIIAEDYGSASVLKVVRTLLRTMKASRPPSRLTLLTPHTSPFLPSLIPPSLSPSLTLVHLYHRSVLAHLSKQYLLPIEPSPAFWQVIERARDRRLPETLAYGGYEGVQVIGDWSTPHSASAGSIVQILVRKPAGGVKGITRFLAGILSSTENGMVVTPVTDLVAINPIIGPSDGIVPDRPAASHVDLDLPFNLSLTDEQKRRRGEVPLPYAHEGEGVSVDFDEDDEDDEEI